MGLNWRQFELGVLRPALEGEPEVAVKLVGETIWHESDRLQALGQYSKSSRAPFGPGLGIASIEEPTWDWMQLEADKLKWRSTMFYPDIVARTYESLAYDLRLNVLACRFRYKLDKRPLPKNMLADRAEYWLAVYNGSGPRSRVAQYMANAIDMPWVK